MNSVTKLVDSRGQQILLGERLGKGGEGSVYAVEGDDTLVAKLYHQRPLTQGLLAKLQSLIACRSPELDRISAWPRALVHDPRSRDALGILMPRVSDSRLLHELYSSANRRRHFPDARWHHLILAARNMAAAFESMHAAGVIVGDVNQGNILVDKNMCVRFIDCDSFQIEANGTVFHCPVGTPHFTPPELQSQKLRDVRRTEDHDGFGLAVLVFHLLFVGRHPFAGRYMGDGEMSIEKAIAEHRFAFSRHRKERLVEPPPASLLLEELPASLADLFEQAFSSESFQRGRPSASEWVAQLEALIKQRKPCSLDPAHLYYNQLSICPWCRVEDDGGPTFFAAEGASSMVSTGRLEGYDRRIQKLLIPTFTELLPARLAIPKVLKPKRRTSQSPATVCDAAATGVVAAASVCLLGIKWIGALWAGAIGSIAAGAFLIFGKPCRLQRNRGDELWEQFGQVQTKLANAAVAVTGKHHKRQKLFDHAVEELKSGYEHYQADQDQLQDVLTLQRTAQLNRLLAGQLIQDNLAEIPGLSSSMLSMLQSFGVESAFDVDSLKLMGVPMLSPSLQIELVSWRDRIAGKYKFEPEHGVSMEDAKVASESALRRFKIAQARKILMGASQLEALAEVGKAELQRDLKKYDDLADKCRQCGNQVREFQSSRRFLERELNRHALVTALVAICVPMVGYLLRFLFGS